MNLIVVKNDMIYMYNSLSGVITTSNTGIKSYSIMDHLGSVRCIIDQTGKRKYFDYKPFGEDFGDTTHRRGFLGQESNEESPYISLGARWYDPAIGRFLAVDPLFEYFPEQNGYHYCHNSPLNWSDPSGKSELDELRSNCNINNLIVYQDEDGQVVGWEYDEEYNDSPLKPGIPKHIIEGRCPSAYMAPNGAISGAPEKMTYIDIPSPSGNNMGTTTFIGQSPMDLSGKPGKSSVTNSSNRNGSESFIGNIEIRNIFSNSVHVPWIPFALHYLGTAEAMSDNESNPIIQSDFGYSGNDKLGLGWCSHFANAMYKLAKISCTANSSSSFMTWGDGYDEPLYGSLAIIEGTHVGFVVGMTQKNGEDYVVLLGGNQGGEGFNSNTMTHSVCFGTRPLSQIDSFRLPAGYPTLGLECLPSYSINELKRMNHRKK